MKTLLLTLFCIFSIAPILQAEDKDGYRIIVQKTTLERDDTRGRNLYDDRIDRTLGLKVNFKNISMKEKAEATVDYSIIVSRWGFSTPRYEKYTGSEKLAALKQQEGADLTLGKARIGGYANFGNKRYQDKVEAWEVVIKQADGTATSMQSNSSYARMAEKSVKPSN